MSGEEEKDMDVEDCTEDIYGDLESVIFFDSPSKKAKREEPVPPNEEYQSLLEENLRLKERVKVLEKENKNYSSNISSLYLTAKSEMEKKNFTIKSLAERLKNVTQANSKLSREETEKIIMCCQEALTESQAKITLQEITKNLKNVSPNAAGRRKKIKFGNMSVYFFRDQIGFQRDENVTFPTKHKNSDKTESSDPRKDRTRPNNTFSSSNHSQSLNHPSSFLPRSISETIESCDPRSSSTSPNLSMGSSSKSVESGYRSDNKNRKPETDRLDRELDKNTSGKDKRNSSDGRNSGGERRSSRERSPPPSDRRREVNDRNRKFERDRPYHFNNNNRTSDYHTRSRTSRRYSDERYPHYDTRRHNR